MTQPENSTTVKAMAVWHDALARLGIDEVANHYTDSRDALASGLRSLRYSERAETLGISGQERRRQMAELDMAAVHRHIAAGRRLLQERLASAEWLELAPRLDEVRLSADGEASFREGRERWLQLLLESDMGPGDTAEAAQMWDTVMESLQARGATGLLEALDGWLGEMADQLRPELDFGRRAHSPLCFNAWLCMIFALGLAVATLLACLFWGACTWIFLLFIALAEAGVIASCLSVCG